MKDETELKIVENGDPSPKKNTSRKPPPLKQRPTKSLPSERISFSKQLEILRAYAAASGVSGNPVTLEKVADIVKMAESSLPLVNPFFCDIGLIEKVEQKGEAWKYLPCQDVLNFNKAYEWNRETAPEKLSPTLANSWFYTTLAPKLSFAPMDVDEAITDLAQEASAGPDYKPQLRLLISFLEAAGLVQCENGVLKSRKPAAISPQSAKESDMSSTQPHETKEATHPIRPAAVTTSFFQPTQGVVNFHVDVKINMEEFSKWTPDRISSFFSGIAQVLAAKSGIEKESSKENGN